MVMPPYALVLLGLLLAGWAVAAGWAVLAAQQRVKRADAALRQGRRLARMVDESPALPLLVRADGRIEGPPRLAQWLGLEALPQYLTELAQPDAGLAADDLAALDAAVRRCQKTASPFRMNAIAAGASRTLALRGHLADPQISPGGAALVWVFDASDSESEIGRLRGAEARAREDFAALVGLIEAAPMPMWFRGPDGALRLVNSAYVRAVGASDGAAVVAAGTELVEPADGQSAADVARAAATAGRSSERVVAATITGADGVGQRRSLRVTDLPLGAAKGDGGVAGYAVDIEDMEELARGFRAFRETQRALLDQLSAGVAQFDSRRHLAYANLPFLRALGLPPATLGNAPGLERLLDAAREAGRVPESRDFPAWRRERTGWFAAAGVQEEAWRLADGTHLRVMAQPMPDGGLLLLVEDRTETLRISAMRDTLLRTRTATFDSLFEAVAVFAPDGRMELWNRRFAPAWGLDEAFVDTRPRVEALIERIGARLANPKAAKKVGDVVRAATLERRTTAGRAVLADGRSLEFAGVPLPDGNGLLTVLDITDSQKAEDALRQRNAALVEADATKTRFLANMSYEFRTPLTSIGGFAELLEAGLGGELSEGGKEYVAAILTSVARLGEQIENVLDLSQSEAGLLPLAREELDVLAFVTRLAEDRASAIATAGLTLDLRGDRSAGTVSADPRRLGRALGQLIDNAIAATPAGGRILVELSQRRVKGRDRARIVVSDNGPGMDPETLARAQGGLRHDAEGRAVERRQGLGLPLARQLIMAHGGTLDLASEPGLGTTAIVDLP